MYQVLWAYLYMIYVGLVKIVRLFGVEKILGLMAKNVQQVS